MIWHTLIPGHFSCQFENIDTPFQVEGGSDLDYEFCYFAYETVNQILLKLGNWCSDAVISSVNLKRLGIIIDSEIFINRCCVCGMDKG